MRLFVVLSPPNYPRSAIKRAAAAACLLAALAVCRPAAALDPSKTLTQYAHRIWGQEEGLLQPTVYSILQTRDGFLWLGTQDSLIRFDGAHFREYEHGGAAVLHGSLVRSLLEDRAGNLWAGSIGNGLARLGSDGSFKRYGPADGLQSSNIFCLASDSQGVLWLCTDKGLARFDGTSFRFFNVADGLPGAVRTTCEGTDGARWAAGVTFPLTRWNGKRFEVYTGPGSQSAAAVTALDCSKDGTLWVGTEKGLVHIAGANIRTFTVRDGMPDNTVSSLAEAPDGSLWIGTDDGISRCVKGEISVYRTRDGLSHSMVLSLYQDREGSLWAGTKDGLDQFTNPKVTPYTVNEGMSSNDASAVIEDREGKLWVGTLDRGLNVFDGRKFTRITARDGLASDSILSLALDRGGDVWAGTNNGLNRLRNGKVVAGYTLKNGLSGREIRALYVDDRGMLWAGANGGLDSFDGRAFRKRRLPGEETENGVWALTGTDAFRLLVSADTNRLDYLQGGSFSSYPLTQVSRPVDCYFFDPAKDSIWMGTLGSGLMRWHNGTLAHIRVKDGLYDSRIYGILKDDRANFWMASSKGIFRVGLKELEDFADGRISAVSSIPFSTGQLRFECRSGVQPAACRTHDGRLWFSTTSGLVVVDPNKLISNPIPPPVRISSVLINGRRLEPGRHLALKPFERNIEIRYTGLSFISPEKVAFRYILNGYGKNWTDAGTRREAFYTNLPPGDFHFEVLAQNADGIWANDAAALDFTVEPLLYQRRWFFPVLAIAIASIVGALYRARVRRLRQRFDLVLAERGRIARELHDTLLQGISGVNMQLQALWMRLPASREKDTLSEIIKDAGACSTEARQSLWRLRGNDQPASLFSSKLAGLSREFVAETNIGLSLRLDPVSLFRFPEIEFQLLRIAREALTNSLKHASAKIIEVDLRMSRRELRMTIGDDGAGFAPEAESSRAGHFGLLGMRERAEEIGAVLEVMSSLGCGTKILVRLPLGRSGMQESNLEPVAEDRIS